MNAEVWGGKKGEDGVMEEKEGRDHLTRAQAPEL